MGRRRGISDADQEAATPVTLVPLDDSDPAAGMDGGDASQQWAEFEKFRDEAETGTAGKRIWVYRIPTDTAGNPISGVESALLFDAPLDTYTLSEVFARVKREYMARGLGRCLVRIQVRQERQRGVLWQKVIPIEKGTRDDDGAPPVIPGGSESPAMAAIAQMMNRQTELLARIFEQRANAPQLPPPDPFAGAQQIVAMVTGLAGVLAKPAAGAGIGGSVGEIREILKLAQDLGNMKGGELPDDGDGEGGDSVRKILEVGAPYVGLLKSIIERAPSNPMQPRRRLPNPNAAGSASVTPVLQAARPYPDATAGSAAVTPPQSQGEQEMLLTLKKHLGEICTLIEAGSAEAEGIALLVLDAIPAEYDDRFYEIVSNDNYLLKLAAVEPRVKQHAEFFAQVRARIMQEFTDDTQAQGAPSGSD